MTGRSLSTAIMSLDALCRVVVGGFAILVASRSGRLCPTGEVCNAPGLEKLLVGPLIAYALWQLLAIGWEVIWGFTERDQQRSQRNVMIVVVMALPRLVWVIALISAEVLWPLTLILAMTILALVLAGAFVLTMTDG